MKFIQQTINDLQEEKTKSLTNTFDDIEVTSNKIDTLKEQIEKICEQKILNVLQDSNKIIHSTQPDEIRLPSSNSVISYAEAVKIQASQTNFLRKSSSNDSFQEKSGNASSQSNRKKYQIKVVRVVIDDMTPEEIIQEFKKCSPYLALKELEFDRKYTIDLPQGQYTKVILNMDLPTQQNISEHGRMLFKSSSCKCYQYNNVIQCFKCQKFGHFSRDCINQAKCKHCSKEHLSNDCEFKDNSMECINCKNASNVGATFDHNHRASDDRCPCKYLQGVLLSFKNRMT